MISKNLFFTFTFFLIAKNLFAMQDAPKIEDLLVLPKGRTVVSDPGHQKLHMTTRDKTPTDPSTAAYIKAHMRNAKIFQSDAENLHYATTLALEKDKEIWEIGIFVEFGVGIGKTTNFIAEKIGDKILYGFDWFKGLPQDWRPGFPAGTFALREGVKIPPFELEKNIRLIIGLFEDTLPNFVKEKNAPFVFIHIDCEIYSSTKDIFENIKNYIIDGTIIVFDEYFNYEGWQNHEFKAFQEFIEKSNLSYEYVSYNELHQQVTVRIIKKELITAKESEKLLQS